MFIALASDEAYPVHKTIRSLLEQRGHKVVLFGACASGQDTPWVEVAEAASVAVASGECAEGVFLCWSGTGISMAANKVGGIRAALCTDPGMARAARVWNHANVICLSNRLLSDDMAKEILAAWFDAPEGDEGNDAVVKLAELDARHRRDDD